jgi:hypothetical protein
LCNSEVHRSFVLDHADSCVILRSIEGVLY